MPIPRRNETRAALERFFAARDAESVVAAWLFGSVARDTAKASSDVDVAVLFAANPGSALDAGPLDLEGDLERILGRETQVIVMNRAPADPGHANWIETAGHLDGTMSWRWIGADQHPLVDAKVVKCADLPALLAGKGGL